MIGAIRQRANQRGVSNAPIVLENHTKDITDFSDIRLFAKYISKQKDLDVITLKELATRLERGDYPISSKNTAAA